MYTLTENTIAALLADFRIDTSRWGAIPGTNNVARLVRELNEGESVLHVRATGIVRKATVVYVRVRYEGLGLREAHVTKSGRTFTRKLYGSVAGKGGFGEDPRLAASRETFEELGVSISRGRLQPITSFDEVTDSVSYPGLPALFHNHVFGLVLKKGEYKERYEEVTPVAHTVFEWSPLEQVGWRPIT